MMIETRDPISQIDALLSDVPVYFISGLGADHRAFSMLELDFEPRHVRYIEPLSQKESLKSYCRRLSSQIDCERPPILVGLSLGGLMINQIARLREVHKLVFISTLSSKAERPFFFKVVEKVPMYKMIPAQRLKQLMLVGNVFARGVFDWERISFTAMLQDSNASFIKWGIDKAIRWDLDKPKADWARVYGDRDHIFPSSKLDGGQVVYGGTHFMVGSNAIEVSKFLNKTVAAASTEMHESA